MVELLNNEKRVIFPAGAQKKFIREACNKLSVEERLLYKKLGVNKRSFFDWRREKYSLPYSIFKIISNMAGISIPVGIEIKNPYWSTKTAARIGGLAMYKKYGTIGDPIKRKLKWNEWWEKKGKYNPNKYFQLRDVDYPEKSERLAEFTGIVMGDGGITDRQINISLNSVVDRLYGEYVKKLIQDLFGVQPGTYFRKGESTMNIVVSRSKLVKICESLGLIKGNKIAHNLDIPEWINKKNEYQLACIRGLMDTDGCLFLERHRIENKIYSYPRLSLVSASPYLRASVYKIFKKFGFRPFIRNNRSVQLENRLDIKNYFVKIGTSHPKNLEKFKKIYGGVG